MSVPETTVADTLGMPQPGSQGPLKRKWKPWEEGSTAVGAVTFHSRSTESKE